jgi:hypothetical protein
MSNTGSTSGFKYNTGSNVGTSVVGAGAVEAGVGAGLGKNFDRLFESGAPSKDVVSDVFTKYARAAENKKPDYTIGNKLPISYASM